MSERHDRYSRDDVIARTGPSFWIHEAKELSAMALHTSSLFSSFFFIPRLYIIYLASVSQLERYINYKLSWESHKYISWPSFDTTSRLFQTHIQHAIGPVECKNLGQKEQTGIGKSGWAFLLPTFGLVPPSYFKASFTRMKHHKPSKLRMWWAPHLIHWFTLMNITGACLYISPHLSKFFLIGHLSTLIETVLWLLQAQLLSLAFAIFIVNCLLACCLSSRASTYNAVITSFT